jgi:hypothetical protein
VFHPITGTLASSATNDSQALSGEYTVLRNHAATSYRASHATSLIRNPQSAIRNPHSAFANAVRARCGELSFVQIALKQKSKIKNPSQVKP